MDQQEKLKKALKEIDVVYNATISQLEKLHQKKVTLIRQYQQQAETELLQKIRKEIK